MIGCPKSRILGRLTKGGSVPGVPFSDRGGKNSLVTIPREAVQRAAHRELVDPLRDLRVSLGGFHILVAEEFLHGAQVDTPLEQVRRKTVAQNVGRNAASGSI
jgi:hypothetical protein